MGTKPAITKKATNTYQTGATWANVANMYDSSESTYSYARNTTSTANSASYVDGFDFSAIPDYAIIDKVEVHTRFQTTASLTALLNPKGYCCIYLYSKTGNNIGYEIVANGESKSTPDAVQTYTNAAIQSKLNSFGIYDGNVVKFIKEGMRVRIVGGGSEKSSSNSAYSECRIYDNYITVYYSIPDYTITVKGENGTVTGGGTYEHGTKVTLTATPNAGYVFSHWSDDSNASATRTVTVASAATYTAYFTRIPKYVTYDSVFNFQKWKDGGISASNAVVSNITNTGFTLTSNDGVSEGTSTSPLFPVTAGNQYKIDIDMTGAPWDVYIFFYDANTSSGLGLEFADGPTNRFSSHNSPNPERIFTVPEGAVRAVIRVDANGSNNSVIFDNFRIYPAEYEHMSNSVSAEQRSNFGQWDMPTPVRDGYEFTGWGTSPEGNGITYTENSTFPVEDTVLYSQWKKIKSETIKFTSVEIEYTDPLVVNEYFVIKVGVLVE